MTEQFKLVTKTQESKIFKSSATAITKKCYNNLHDGIVSKFPTQAWNKAKISLDTPLKMAIFSAKITPPNNAF